MLFWLFELLQPYYTYLRAFQYISLRTILAIFTSFILAIVLGPKLIKKLKALNLNQFIRKDGPSEHMKKQGTPTMGGSIILISTFISTLLWCKLSQIYIWLMMAVIIGYGTIGCIDDYLKISNKNSDGLSARYKFILQSVLAALIIYFIYTYCNNEYTTILILPFIKQGLFDLGWFFPVFAYFVIVGSSNAVNLTDGLDGLAIVPTVLVVIGLGIFCYVGGNVSYAKYLGIPYISGTGELAVFCGAIIGSGLGFLWFNAYPAQVFMGDVGALSLGAILGVISILIKQELILFIMGGLFVLETLSVILQVASFKLTGKRIFRMAPLHHHFELLGWPEPRIIVRFWIISLLLVLIGLTSLKIR